MLTAVLAARPQLAHGRQKVRDRLLRGGERHGHHQVLPSRQREEWGILPPVKGMRRSSFPGKIDGESPMKKSRFSEAQRMGVLRRVSW